MVIYISGAISGTDDYMERFQKVEDKLLGKGESVINPARFNANLPSIFCYEDYMKLDFTMIELCDAIYMMKGWEKSCGANREYGYALGLGKTILFEEVK
ncbi:MAG: DUF4406 domain-containing protein [Bacteroidales bacterium]|nr:DUF4406 domain-containing protein [Lachnoclostridium sp.]MCM1385279.1 DUF4406 domain-containing protein [Lachnoclostridium sp.]MCM1466135.1 DUF4406 domain-containing protein [Bacteroidales bacterium]